MATKHPFTGIARRQAPPPPARDLLEELREVRRQLEGVQSYFAIEKDEDLLDAAIYQREALEARHRYLLRLARESKATAETLPILTDRERWIN